MKRALCAAVVVASVAVLRVPARACDPVTPSTADVPANGQVNVPRNTLVTNAPDASLRVERTGEAIPLELVQDTAMAAARAFRPRQPLPPDEWIAIGTERRFRTGAALEDATPEWQLVRVVHNKEPRPVFGCSANSCAGLETIEAHVRPRNGTTVERPLFHIVNTQSSPDSNAVLFAFVEPMRSDDGATHMIVVHSASHALVPVGASGVRGTPLSVNREEGGCRLVGARPAAGTLVPLAMLGLLCLALRVRRGCGRLL